MNVVLRALPHSTLTRTEQLLWLIEHQLQDEFSLLESSEKLIKSSRYKPADWSELADILTARLTKLPKNMDSYRRKGWVQWLLTAYEHAHRDAQIIPLLEQEAEPCHLQEQVVDALLAKGEKTKARQYCIRFYTSTIKDLPGIASDMQIRLRDMAQHARQYDLVAAYYAQDFFARASIENFTLLRKASEKAACWPKIRSAVLVYLETGARPDNEQQRKSKYWPLPQPEVMPPTDNKKKLTDRLPQLDLLIDIAIQEQRLDDTVRLFEQVKKTERGSWFYHVDERVAKAVVSSHPQVALDIWRKIVEQKIGRVAPSAYVEAATYLRLMHKVYQATQRLPEWNSLLVELRTKHKAKRRLLEVLDNLASKKLIA